MSRINFKDSDKESKIVYFAVLSVFLHFAVTAATIIAIGLFVIFNGSLRREIFAKKSHLLLSAFCLYTLLTALFNKNYIGIICSVTVYLLMLVFYWIRTVITKEMLENALNLCCAVAIPLSLAVLVERIIHIESSKYRCQLWFFNANYMTALFAAIALFCVYKIIDDAEHISPYMVSLISSGIAMYLSGSMFAFVELFVAICLLLILCRKYTVLAGFSFLVFLGLVLLYFFPEIFPRILLASVQTDKRIEVWNWAIVFIKQHPIFGQGFLTFYHNALQNSQVYNTTHAHSFVLEPLVSFGVVGTIMVIGLLFVYFSKVIKCKEQLKDDKITALILSLSGGVLIHAFTDLTLMWIQTGLLYVFIFATVGIGERKLAEQKTLWLNKNGEMHYGK